MTDLGLSFKYHVNTDTAILRCSSKKDALLAKESSKKMLVCYS